MKRSPLFTILLLAICVVCQQCMSILYPDYIRNEIKATTGGVSTQVLTNGYYKMRDKKHHMDVSFVFFKNGIFHYNTTLGLATSDKNAEYRFVYCGTYKQSGDTIYTTYMSSPSINGGFTAFKFDFLVLKGGQLAPLCERVIHASANDKSCVGEEFFSMPTFTRLNIPVQSKCFLTEEDWFYDSGL